MNRDSIHKEEYKGFTIKILLDDVNDSPRDWDNAGKMVCWHSRYNLGDEQPKESPNEYMAHITEKNFIILPVYIYDHSGITISTSYKHPYNDRWDAGQVGWIYISKKDAVKEWGKKIFTKNVEKRATEYLRGEVKTYDDYLRGNVYGYQVCDEDEVIDSVWGFYPEGEEYPSYGYCLKEAKESADWYAKEKENKVYEKAQALELAEFAE